MIAKSDLIILVCASSLLVVGMARWQYNIRPSQAITVPASVRLAPPPSPQPAPEVITTPTTSATALSTGPAPRTPDGNGNDPEVETARSDAAPDQPEWGVHVVSSGEYLSLIAQKYDTTVRDLTALNDINGDTIYVGQELRYPRAN